MRKWKLVFYPFSSGTIYEGGCKAPKMVQMKNSYDWLNKIMVSSVLWRYLKFKPSDNSFQLKHD